MDKNPTHIHTFKEVVVPPTCKDSGYTLHSCDCGYQHKDNFTPAGNHNFQLLEETQPTCTEEGHQKLQCSICGELAVNTVPALDHEWGEGSVQTFATCTEDGTELYICHRCGQAGVLPIPATGHKLSLMGPSATETDMMEYFCENCGQTVLMPSAPPKPTGFFAAHKKLVIGLAATAALVSVLLVLTFTLFIPSYRYNRAQELIKEGNYTEAYRLLNDCNGYKDSEEQLKDFSYTFRTAEIIDYGENDESEKIVIKADRYGNITLISQYDEDENPVKVGIEYKYDDCGNPIHVTSRWDGELRSTTELEYDKNDNVVLRLDYYDGTDKIRKKSEFEYDANGKTKEMIVSYRENGAVDDKYENRYDKSGNLIFTSSTHYDDYGNVEYAYKHNYEYDDKGNEIYGNVIRYDKYGSIDYKSEDRYKYDDKGNETWKLTVSYDQNGLEKSRSESTFVNEYDEKGNLSRQTEYDEDGNAEYITEYRYDEEGNCIGTHGYSVGYYDDGLVTDTASPGTASDTLTYKREYDDNGNLIYIAGYNKHGDMVGEVKFSDYVLVYRLKESDYSIRRLVEQSNIT